MTKPVKKLTKSLVSIGMLMALVIPIPIIILNENELGIYNRIIVLLIAPNAFRLMLLGMKMDRRNDDQT